MSDGVSRYSLPTSASTCADNHNDSASRSRSPTLLPETPTTRGARHIRNASLKAVRPGPNATPAEIDAILDERDQIIDRLRAEVGLAKVQEQQAVQLGDRARRELEVVRQAADEANTQHQALETEVSYLVPYIIFHHYSLIPPNFLLPVARRRNCYESAQPSSAGSCETSC